MKKLILLALLIVSLFLFLASSSSRGSRILHGVVEVEPLSCFQGGQKLVCFDGNPIGTLACRELDVDTVLCSR